MIRLLLLALSFTVAQTVPLMADADAQKRRTSRASKPAAKKGSSSRRSSVKSSSSSGVYYRNCTAAREAGAAPVMAGDPGYSRKLDRDGDGVGCE
jgi:hypothetical protein